MPTGLSSQTPESGRPVARAEAGQGGQARAGQGGGPSGRVADGAEGVAADPEEATIPADPVDQARVVLQRPGVDPGGLGEPGGEVGQAGGIAVAVDAIRRAMRGEVAVGEEIDGCRSESWPTRRCRGRSALGAEDQERRRAS